jgi:hypothetical protein
VAPLKLTVPLLDWMSTRTVGVLESLATWVPV